MPDPEDKEKEVEPSEEEKDDKPSEFTGGPEEAAAQFFKEKAEKEKPSEEEIEVKPEEKPSEEKEEVVEETPPDPHLWIVDKDGNKTPLIVKADGKLLAPDKADKALQWGGLGVHANTVLEGVKKDKEDFEKSKPILDMILTAYKEKKIMVMDEDGKPVALEGTQKTEEEPGDDESLIDPEVAQLKKNVKELQDDKLQAFIQGEKGKIEASITEQGKTHFAAIDRSKEDAPKEVWDLLTEKKADGSGPKYTVEEAMKISHDSNIASAKKLIAANPKEFEVDEDAIYARKLKEKQEKEEAPVSPPSDTPVVIDAKSEDLEKFEGGPADAFELFKKQHKGKEAAGRKS